MSSERMIRYSNSSVGNKRPYTVSILGPLTPWDTKVGDVFCDTCGKNLLPDIKLVEWYDALDWQIESAKQNHFRKNMPPQYYSNPSDNSKERKKKIWQFFIDVCLQKEGDTTYHSQCTLKWIPEIERKLKQQGVF